MATVIETSMWMDFFPPKTPGAVKSQIKPGILREDAAVCEPVVCELLRSPSARERPLIQRHFATLPMLPTPVSLWPEATERGRNILTPVSRSGRSILIAAICIHQGARLVTFDDDLAKMAKLSRLQASVLRKAS